MIVCMCVYVGLPAWCVYICSDEVTSIYKLSTIAIDVQSCVVYIVECTTQLYAVKKYKAMVNLCSPAVTI